MFLQGNQWVFDPSDWKGVRSSTNTRFLEASIGCLKPFKKDTRERFLKYDGTVLKFMLLRVEDDNLGPEQRIKYQLSYHMATEECEINELRGQRRYMSGLTFYKRSRLPKALIGHDDRMRNAEVETGDEDYYNEDDFVVGESIYVLGNMMLIYDCDETTNTWYSNERGIDQKSNAIDVELPPVAVVPMVIPPPTGYGSEADSLRSCLELYPHRIRRDPPPTTGESYRFGAKMVNSDAIDKSREFKITYFTDDGSVSVYEPSMRNSGLVAGLFLKRDKQVNPSTQENFRLQDFVPGSSVQINRYTFQILAQEYPAPK
jgi:hypothetical protein